MEFEWDEAKNRSNQIKHGVAFALAETFGWSEAIIEVDDRRDYGEERLVAHGFADDGFGYHIAFTIRVDVVRIISARRFNSKDYQRYGT